MQFPPNKKLLTLLILKLFVGCASNQKPIDAKKLINKDMLMYKPKLILKILGPGKVYTGKVISYFKNGKTESEGTYLNGEKDGNWKYWYETGGYTFESKGSYKGGNRDGFWTYWYPNGEIREDGNFKLQERVGKWTYYNEDGSLDIVINH